MSFSPDWLALREPADHAARSGSVAQAVKRHFAGHDLVSIVDLGCGAGSNLRGIYDLFPKRQRWKLVDHDPVLLETARARLTAWADSARDEGGEGALRLVKTGHSLEVVFRQADLSRGVDAVLPPATSLVTAAALFDLTSTAWIERFAASLKARGLPLYTVLTYDGRDHFDPPHPLDGAMLAAFHADMGRDKGFGPSAGPRAARALVQAFEGAGYAVATGDSPWVLDAGDPLAIELAKGFTNAVIATGRVDADAARDWLALRLAGGTWETRHTDVFAR